MIIITIKKDNSYFSKTELSSLSNILSVCWKQMVSIHPSVHSSFKYKFMVFSLLFIGGRDVRWFNFSCLFHLPIFLKVIYQFISPLLF